MTILTGQANAILKRLASQDGYTEGPNNANIFSQHFKRDHESWCCRYISWGFDVEHSISLIEQMPHQGYANCAEFQRWAIAKKLTVPVSQIRLGDILLYGEKGKPPYHTGFAATVVDPKTKIFGAWEGNTSADHNPKGSQDNGDGVHYRHRSSLWVLTVVRPPYTH